MDSGTSSSILIVVVCMVAITGFVKVLNVLWIWPKRSEKLLRQQGVPGTSYRFLVGDWKDKTSMDDQARGRPVNGSFNDYIPLVEPFRQKLMAKYGKTYFMWGGPILMFHTSKPELIREALTKMHEFRRPKLKLINKLFTGLFNYEGEQWAKHRRMVNPAFNMEKLKILLPVFYDSSVEMISKWEKIVSEAGSGELDVWPYLSTLSAEVISRAAFSSSYQEGHRIFELLNEEANLALGMLDSLFIPGLSYLPTTRNRRFKEVENQIQTLLKGIIDKRKQAIKDGEAIKADLLGILMDSNFFEVHRAEGNNKKEQLGLSLQEMIDECKLFYVAGQETTSSLLVWTMILLSKHQDWQARARQEVLRTFGNNPPNFDGLNHLKTVTMILYEVLRLYPPSIVLGRTTYEDTKLGELSLPAGTFIVLEALFLNRDKDVWGENAEEFKPDRFSEGISQATRGTNSFFPFGWGPRMCIGEKFALTEAKMALSIILARFSFELSPSYIHAPKVSFHLTPKHGAQIILRKL